MEDIPKHLRIFVHQPWILGVFMLVLGISLILLWMMEAPGLLVYKKLYLPGGIFCLIYGVYYTVKSLLNPKKTREEALQYYRRNR